MKFRSRLLSGFVGPDHRIERSKHNQSPWLPTVKSTLVVLCFVLGYFLASSSGLSQGTHGPGSYYVPPPYVPPPAPVSTPPPAPVSTPKPAPVHTPRPAPVYKPRPAPVYKPRPAPVYGRGPTPSQPRPTNQTSKSTLTPAPSGAYAPEKWIKGREEGTGRNKGWYRIDGGLWLPNDGTKSSAGTTKPAGNVTVDKLPTNAFKVSPSWQKAFDDAQALSDANWKRLADRREKFIQESESKRSRQGQNTPPPVGPGVVRKNSALGNLPPQPESPYGGFEFSAKQWKEIVRQERAVNGDTSEMLPDLPWSPSGPSNAVEPVTKSSANSPSATFSKKPSKESSVDEIPLTAEELAEMAVIADEQKRYWTRESNLTDAEGWKKLREAREKWETDITLRLNERGMRIPDSKSQRPVLKDGEVITAEEKARYDNNEYLKLIKSPKAVYSKDPATADYWK